MKKQFYKVKQLADQTFSRSGKTEVLADDLQAANKHVEHISNTVAGLNKRFGNPSNQPNINDPGVKEKRIKKCPEYLLGQAMLENVAEDGKGLISYTLNECGKVELALANEYVDHECKVEQLVANPIHQLIETDIPNIHRLKKELRVLIGNVENLRSRYQQANNKHHGAAGPNATKIENIKDDLDRAETKVEQCQDQLAAEMFQLMSKEAVLAQTIFQYVKLQRAYHESALHCLKDVIPQLERYINDNQMKPVYGCSLEKHLRLTNRKIALPIQLCICALLKIGMEEQGLFRIASGAAKLRRIKMSFDAWCITLPIALEYDPHTLAGALKSYLRELPEPLLTFQLYPEWMSIARIQNNSERQRLISDLLQRLPPANFANLRFLIKFLAILAKTELNKMTCQTLGIIVAPNLLWSLQEDNNIVMDTANNSSLIVEQLITNASNYFPGEVDFFEDLEPTIPNGSETHQTAGLQRCVSTSSLSDHGESPSQGSPKPATRRKNKPAPTPPSGTTPDKQFHERRPDDKPPPAPDKPPRPLSTANINRASYKSAKHSSASAELLNFQSDRSLDNSSTENDARPIGFEFSFEDNFVQDKQNTDSSLDQNKDEQKVNPLIGFEALSIRAAGRLESEENEKATDSEIEDRSSGEKPSTLERRKVPVAAPRNLFNLSTNQHADEIIVELRKKAEGTNNYISAADRNSRPSIPDRPAMLVRPSSLIRPHPRNNNCEITDCETAQSTLERNSTQSSSDNKKSDSSVMQLIKHSTPDLLSVESNENSTLVNANLQRSPSVGSRPVSMSISDHKPERPPRPELPESIKAHTRTRSEGNILDVELPSNECSNAPPKTILTAVQNQQLPPASPRIYQRPPRPIPPPPPPPTAPRPKSEESTNL